jgi:hypothetical protein
MTADSSYGDTILEIATNQGLLRVDLRESLDARLSRHLRDLFGGPFAIVTAYNPRGAIATEVENTRCTRRLAEELRQLTETLLPADGRSPGAGHRERGFAVPLELEEAVRLAIRYEQEALFWFDGESFQLVGALQGGEMVSLPVAPDDPR